MYEIITKRELAPKIKLFKVKAPDIAAKANPGQFVILVMGEKGERVPLTIADYDAGEGSIKFAFNEVGKTTKQMGCFKEGDFIQEIVKKV